MPFSQLYKGENFNQEEDNIGPYSDALMSVLKGLHEDTPLPYIDYIHETKHFLIYCPANENYLQKLKNLHPIVDLAVHIIDAKNIDKDQVDPEILKNKIGEDIQILKQIRFKHLVFLVNEYETCDWDLDLLKILSETVNDVCKLHHIAPSYGDIHVDNYDITPISTKEQQLRQRRFTGTAE